LGFSIVGYCLVMLVISIKEIIPGESTYKGTAWAIILLFLQGLMGFLFASFYYFTQTI
jgi:hypothetical protein